MRAPRVTAEAFDDYAYYYPMFHYAFDEVRHGRLPLWNPYQHCGSPFLATGQHLLFYPLNALYVLLPTALAMKVTNVLHLALAVLFTYVLGRTLGLVRPASLTAGVLFAFSPVVTNNVYAPHHLYGITWMPLHLALVHRILSRPRKARPAILLGATFAAQYLGGYPHYCLFSAYLMSLYVAWYAVSERRAISRASLAASAAALGGAAVLAALLALPQLLPGVELARLSPRHLGGLSIRGVDPGYRPGWTLPLQTLVGTLLPTWNAGFASGFAPHVGAVGVALAVVGAAFPRKRSISAFFAVVALASALLGVGRHTPLYDLYFLLPTSDWFRGPSRFFVLTALGLAMLAGIGVDALARARVSRTRMLVLLGGALACVATGGAVLAVVGGRLSEAGQYLERGGVGLPGEIPFPGRLWLLCGYGLAAGAWLAAYMAWQRGRRLLVVGLPVAAYATLFTSFISYAPLPEVYPALHDMPGTVAEFLRAHQGQHRTYIVPWGTFISARWLPPPDRAAPLPPQPVAAKAGMLERIYVVGDRENVYPARISDYADRMVRPEDAERLNRLLASLGASKADGLPQGDFGVGAGAPNLRLLDLLGTRFIVEGPQTSFGQNEAPQRFPLVHESDGVKVYENVAVYPRAFVAGQAEVIPEPARVLDRLTDPGFDPLATVILEDASARALPAGGAAPRSTVRFATYAPDEVILDVVTSAPGYLVLTDQYYPGWSAEIDATPAAIRRADYLFRAVFVNAGAHRVVFRYAPRSLRVGLMGAGLGVALLVLWLLADRRARRPRPARAA